MYAGVVVNNESSQVDRIFSYEIPVELENIIKPGYRVKVPFGMGNKCLDGFVLDIFSEDPKVQKIKKIKSICDSFPVLRAEDIKLITLMKEKYLSTYLECIKTIIPTGLLSGITSKTAEKLYAAKAPEGRFKKETYNLIYEIIINNDGQFTASELIRNYKVSQSSVNTMIKYGFLRKSTTIINRYNEKLYDQYEEKKLNEDQTKTMNTVLHSGSSRFLIHGVTGSGKTEIYLHIVKEMMKQNKSSIILVPEISLTPQMVERFKGRFGSDITVFHSKLSEGERYDEWLRVKEGKVKVAVGARSAIFLPMNNLGAIIIDEEHEASYKSETNPKYNAKEIAALKQQIEGNIVVLGSATPSIETYDAAIKGYYKLITLEKRADGAIMPQIEVVDMREELLQNNKSIFSRKLYEGIEECLESKEQIILFLNRRGYSSFVSCRKCGFVFKCSKCDITLTYHNSDDSMVCHYCGSKEPVKRICPHCGSKYVKYFGVGTEKIEQEIQRLFPNAVTLRMDFDTTRRKNAYEDIYNSFKEHKADILIGTQMIAKGLDFKNVTLVGVVAADISLNLPDFRSAERTFQLITQVSGRAGRGKKPGKVVIQTYNPEHYSITHAARNDYIGFFREDLEIRQNLNYPPFSDILCLNFSSKNESLLISTVQNIGNVIKSKLQHTDISILGPCPCGVSKIKEHFRWQIVLKGEISVTLAAEVKILVYNLMKNVYNDIRISIDINPTTLL